MKTTLKALTIALAGAFSVAAPLSADTVLTHTDSAFTSPR